MLKRNGIREAIIKHINANIGLYFLVFTFFAIGIATGAFSVKALDGTQRQSLIEYMQDFFQVLLKKDVDSYGVLGQSIKNNMLTGFLIWIFGISVVGIPLTLIIVAIRGFILGFTVSFLINSMGIKGVLFSALAILPQNLIIIPCIVAIGVVSISFSRMVIKNKITKKWTHNYWQKFFSYSMIIIIFLLVSIAGSLIEAYIVPVFAKVMSSYLTAS
ncbi:MAG: stage II sporulation protein M [Clostridiales bacterium]|nr:stage II sporulation protein M [Clostridiales bacterium]